MMNIEVSERLSVLLASIGCTGHVAVWEAGPADDLTAKLRVDVLHDGDTCPIHEADESGHHN